MRGGPFVCKERRQAVTPAIATMLLLVLVLTITIIMIIWSLPRIQDMQSDASYSQALSYFEAFNSNVNSVSKGNVGDTSTSQLQLTNGDYSIKEGVEYWVMEYQFSKQYTVLFKDLDDGDNKVVVFSPDDTISGVEMLNCRVNVSWPIQSDYAEATQQLIFKSGGGASTVYYFTTEFEINQAAQFTISYKGQNIAQCWVVALDEVGLNLKTVKGGYYLREINNALTSDYPTARHVEIGPDFLLNQDTSTCIANFVKFKPNGITSASEGSYSIDLRLKTIGLGDAYARDLRMEITGDYSDVWYNYFENQFSNFFSGGKKIAFIREAALPGFSGLKLVYMDNGAAQTDNLYHLKVRISVCEIQTEVLQ